MGPAFLETRPYPGERFENVIDKSLNTSARGNRRRTLASRLRFILGVTGAAFLGIASHEAAADSSVSQVDTAHYSVFLNASPFSRGGNFRATRPGSASFTVVPKGKFTIDRTHPWTLKLHNPPGDKVAFVKDVYSRADALLDDGSVTFSLPFLARSAGRVKLEGVIDVRVCNPAGKCDAKSETVALEIEIAAPRADDSPEGPR